MFSRKDTQYDIAAEMEKILSSTAKETVEAPFNKIASAIDLLNRAAEIFDQSGFYVEAEIATRLLEVFAGKKKKKSKKPAKKTSKKPTKSSKKPASKSKKTDPATKGLSSEKMVENLKHKGWVFNADDGMEDTNDAVDMNFMHDGGKNHGDDCMCSYCMDDAAENANGAFGGGEHQMGGRDDMQMADDYERDERESELARIMHDLENEDEMRHDFEDDGEHSVPMLPEHNPVHPGDDYSRSMHFLTPHKAR